MKKKGLQIDAMAIYRIKVQGALGEEAVAHMYDLDVHVEAVGEGELTVTTLTGQLPDQVALKQVLNTLYNQRLPILSLEYLEEEKTKRWQELNDEDFLSD